MVRNHNKVDEEKGHRSFGAKGGFGEEEGLFLVTFRVTLKTGCLI
jgi:hypothetical protein